MSSPNLPVPRPDYLPVPRPDYLPVPKQTHLPVPVETETEYENNPNPRYPSDLAVLASEVGKVLNKEIWKDFQKNLVGRSLKAWKEKDIEAACKIASDLMIQCNPSKPYWWLSEIAEKGRKHFDGKDRTLLENVALGLCWVAAVPHRSKEFVLDNLGKAEMGFNCSDDVGAWAAGYVRAQKDKEAARLEKKEIKRFQKTLRENHRLQIDELVERVMATARMPAQADLPEISNPSPKDTPVPEQNVPPVAKSMEKMKGSLEIVENALPDDQVVDITPQLDDVNTQGDQLNKEIEDDSLFPVMMEKALRASIEIGKEIYSFQHQNGQHHAHDRQFRQAKRGLEAARQGVLDRLNPHTPLITLPNIQKQVYQKLTPNGMRDSIANVKKFSESYKKSLGELDQALQQAKVLGSTFQDRLKNIDFTDKKLKAKHEAVLRAQKKLRGSLSKWGTILSCASTALMFVNPALGLAAGAAAVGVNMKKSSNDRHISKTERRLLKGLQKNHNERAQTVDQALEVRQAEQAALIQRENLDNIALTRPDQFKPSEQKKEVDRIHKERHDKEDSLKKDLKDKEDQIKQKREQLAQNKGNLHHKHRKTRKAAEAQDKKLNDEIASLEKDINTGKKSLENDDIGVSQADEIKKETDYLLPIRDMIFKDLEKMEDDQDPLVEKFRSQVEEAFSVKLKPLEKERQLVEQGLNEAMGLARELGYLFSSQKPALFVDFIGRTYQVWSLKRYFCEVAYPILELIQTHYTTNHSLSEAANKMGTDKFTSKFIYPCIRALTVGLSVVRGTHEIYTLFKGAPKFDPEKTTLEQGLKFFSVTQGLKAFYDYMNEHFNNLESVSNGHFKELKECIAFLGNQMLNELVKVEELVKNEARDIKFTHTLTRLKIKTNEIDSEAKKLKGDLFSSKTILGSQFDKYIIHIENENASTRQDFNNGFNSESSLVRDGIVFAPSIDLSHTHRNPEHLTGLIGVQLGQEGLVNWAMHNQLCLHFLDVLEEVFDHEENGESILFEKREAVHELMEQFEEDTQKLLQLRLKIPSLIRKLRGYQRKLKDKIQSNIEHAQKVKEELHKKDIEEALKKYQSPKEWVGSKKFYLAEELAKRNLSDMLSPIDYRELADTEKYGSPLAAHAKRVSLASAITLFFGALSYFSLQGGFKTAGIVTGGIGATYSFLQTAEVVQKGITVLGDNLDSNYLTLCLTTEKIRGLIEQPFKKTNLQDKNLAKSQKRESLSLDLSSRKITLLTPNPKAGIYPLADVEVGINPPEVAVHISKNSLVKPHEVVDITLPSLSHPNKEAYDKAVKDLNDNYFCFIQAAKEGKAIHEMNPFKRWENQVELITPEKEGGLTLAFPKSFMERRRLALNPELRQMEATGVGSLKASYEFSCETGKMVMKFKFVDSIKGEVKHEFADFEIAEVDPLVLRVFEPNLLSPTLKDPTEALLTLMYGALFQLGLPGKDTVVLASGLIAPDEKAYPGFYQLWENDPDAKLYYSLQRASTYPMPLPNLSTQYLDIYKKVHGIKKDMLSFDKDFSSGYSMLIALSSLFSSLDKRSLHQLLREDLGLLPPGQQDMVFDSVFEKADDENNLEHFMDSIVSFPSDQLKRMEHHLKRLETLKSDLENIEEPEKEAVKEASPLFKQSLELMAAFLGFSEIIPPHSNNPIHISLRNYLKDKTTYDALKKAMVHANLEPTLENLWGTLNNQMFLKVQVEQEDVRIQSLLQDKPFKTAPPFFALCIDRKGTGKLLHAPNQKVVLMGQAYKLAGVADDKNAEIKFNTEWFKAGSNPMQTVKELDVHKNSASTLLYVKE